MLLPVGAEHAALFRWGPRKMTRWRQCFHDPSARTSGSFLADKAVGCADCNFACSDWYVTGNILVSRTG